MDQDTTKRGEKDEPEDDAGLGRPGGLLDLLREQGTVAPGDDLPASAAQPKPASALPNPWEAEQEWRRPPGEQAADADFSHASHLRKILDAPDDSDENFELARGPAAAVNADYDSAVQTYMRNADQRISCRKHADRASVSQCPECEAYFCQECMTIRRGRMLCRDCADTVFIASEEAVIEAQARGGDVHEGSVAAEAPPEFQLGAEWMGREGAPASPLKTMLALAIDYAVVRGLFLVALLVFNAMGLVKPGIFEGFFDPDNVPLKLRLLHTFVLMKPLIPWAPLFAAADFLYYFLSLSFTNRTLGMSWTSCRIISQWGEFVSFGGVALRTIIFLSLGEFPALLLSVFLPRYRGPHDLIAGTVVINYAGVKRVDSYDSIQLD